MLDWCKRHPVIVNVCLWGFYIGCFFLVEHLVRVPRFIIHCGLDDVIPFVKYAVWPYLLWFPYILLSLLWLLNEDCKNFWKLSLMMVIAMLGVLLFYVVMPNGLDLRPKAVEGQDLTTIIVNMLWRSDTACNVCPSIHVMDSLLIDFTLTGSLSLREHKEMKWLSHIVCIAICLSTMFLKQHSVIDVLAGAGCAVVVYAIGEMLTEKDKNM